MYLYNFPQEMKKKKTRGNERSGEKEKRVKKERNKRNEKSWFLQGKTPR